MARSQAGGGRRVDWFAAGLGLVLAVVIQLVGGTLLFGSHRGQLVSQGLLTFGALLAGGFAVGHVAAIWGSTLYRVFVAEGCILLGDSACVSGCVTAVWGAS